MIKNPYNFYAENNKKLLKKTASNFKEAIQILEEISSFLSSIGFNDDIERNESSIALCHLSNVAYMINFAKPFLKWVENKDAIAETKEILQESNKFFDALKIIREDIEITYSKEDKSKQSCLKF